MVVGLKLGIGMVGDAHPAALEQLEYKMRCTVHNEVRTEELCDFCARPFCSSCIGEVKDYRYCHECLAKHHPTIAKTIEESRSLSEYLPVQPHKEIGGWLILPSIGLTISPIIGAINLFRALSMSSEVEDAGYGGFYSLWLLVELGLLIFLIFAAIRFFSKKRNAPSIIIALLITYLLSYGLLLLIALGAEAEIFAIESGKQFVKIAVSSAIWIPYFKVSKRVKATFVN